MEGEVPRQDVFHRVLVRSIQYVGGVEGWQLLCEIDDCGLQTVDTVSKLYSP
jgi:hypothetical protein